jgi:hypothetical protein
MKRELLLILLGMVILIVVSETPLFPLYISILLVVVYSILGTVSIMGIVEYMGY